VARIATTEQSDEGLFAGGPPLRLQMKVGLVQPGRLHVVRRVLLFVAVAWVPLGVLAAIEGNLFSVDYGKSFLLDFGAFSRYVVAAPLLLAAEVVCITALSRDAARFVEFGIVADRDLPRFAAAAASTRRLRDGWFAELSVVIAGLALAATVAYSIPVEELPTWRRSYADGAGLSLAGWWNALVSLPLLLILFLGWFWRIFLWARFLFLVSLLDLQLVAAHPDGAAGLRFIGYSLRAFCLVGAALGAIAAGAVANRVLHDGADLIEYRYLIGGVAVVAVVLCAAPLLAFTHKLLDVWRRGVHEYSALASEFGRRFELEWLEHRAPMDRTVLERPDFSAATDLYQVVDRVQGLRIVPVDLVSVVMLIGATLLPFGVVVLMALPFDVVFSTVLGLLK
jgi:hypothetical protein